MIQVRYAPLSGVELRGTTADLYAVKSSLIDLITSGTDHIVIQAREAYDPTPYDHVLQHMVVRKGSGPTNVVVRDDHLEIKGGTSALAALASCFDVAPDVSPEWHTHYEYFDGSHDIVPTAAPLVIAIA